jgi:phage FluMu protein Com
MCVVNKEILLSISELRYLSVRCPDKRCRTVVTLDLTSTAKPQTMRSQSSHTRAVSGLRLGNHPKTANDNHLKTGQR